MNLPTAQQRANYILKILAPHCERIEVAGSIRRQKKDGIKDVEIVCIPKLTTTTNLFSEAIPQRSPGFIAAISQLRNSYKDSVGFVHKGIGQPTGKYCKRYLEDNTQVDIFIATPDNWGFILAIRTGNAKYSSSVLGTAWKAAGYYGADGMLHKATTHQPVPVKSEEDFFKLIGVQYVAPKFRERLY